mgnify:FL=1
MKIRIFMGGLVLALSTFTLNGDKVSAEELTVATFIPPQHHINKNLFGWFGKEIAKRSGGSLTMKLFPSGQLGAGPA